MLLDRLIIWDHLQRHQPATTVNLGSLRNWTERYTLIAQNLAMNG